MSSTPINLSPHLIQLRDEGFEVEVVAGHVVIRNVPFVNAQKQIRRGHIIAPFSDATGVPPDHTIMFSGEYPCDENGKELAHIHDKNARQITPDLAVTCGFSSKPPQADKNYYDKVTRYVALISGHAQAIDPGADARTWRVVENTDPKSPFVYCDSASSKAGITMATRKLELKKIGIIGAGGTGSYTLDGVAKTPVEQIHLFDGDKVGQHNAFRMPGAASIEELKQQPYKVVYLKAKYSLMHKGIVAHPYAITAENVEELRDMDFTFICADAGSAKAVIIEKLTEWNIPFIDAGMGLQLVDDTLIGTLTVTTSTEAKRDHVKARVPTKGDGNENIYAKNIQIADLNMFSAGLALLRWKRLYGFYADYSREHFTAYTIDGNSLVSEDKV